MAELITLAKKEGYHTSFYFGGHLMYGGIKSYLRIAGFDEMTEIYDLPDSLPRGKLGVHDEFLFSYQLNDLKNIRQPFLSEDCILSLGRCCSNFQMSGLSLFRYPWQKYPQQQLAKYHPSGWQRQTLNHRGKSQSHQIGHQEF